MTYLLRIAPLRVAAAALVCAAVLTLGAGAALAEQPAGGDHAGHGHAQPGDHVGHGHDAPQRGDAGHAHGEPVGGVHTVGAPAHPSPGGQGRVTALFFWLFALGTIGGALFVITRRNLVAAVMGMVGTFFALAGLYLMLYAGFLAVIQVLVYAGAIMVLFVFVIMILNREEDEPWAVEGLLGKALAGIGLLYLLGRLGKILWDLREARPHVPAPEPVVRTVIENGQAVEKVYEFGSVRGVGQTLFTDYIFPFEAVSLVLLVAVVGAIAIARPFTHREETPGAGTPDPDTSEAS